MFGVANTCIVECNMPVIGKFCFLVIDIFENILKKNQKKSIKNQKISGAQILARLVGV